MIKQAKEWWNKHAIAYQKETNIPIDIHYGPGSPNEDELQLIGDVKNKHVLELGCGGAQCSIAFAKKGAIVIAADISYVEIEFAKKLATENKVQIQFYERDIVDLTPIVDKSQDIVFSAFALMYIDDLSGCFKEIHRVLKDDGIFVWSVGHPFHDVIDSKTFQLRESYLDTGIKIEDDFANVLRTVSDYFNITINAGFVVEKMIEPDSRKHYPHDPWYGLWDYSPELLAKVPATLIFKCRKK